MILIDNPISGSLSTIIGRSAIKHTAYISTTYHDTTDTTSSKRPLQGRHIYSFSKFKLVDGSSGTQEAFQGLKSALIDEEGITISLHRKFTCKLTLTVSTTKRRLQWEGYMVEKGLTVNSRDPLTLFDPSDTNSEYNSPRLISRLRLSGNTRTQLRKLWVDRSLSFHNRTKAFKAGQFQISTGQAEVDVYDDVIVSMRRVPLLWSIDDSQDDRFGNRPIVAITTDHQDLGGWPGVQGPETKDWVGRLTWWEVQPRSQEAESSKDRGKAAEDSFESCVEL